jgi:hypothetical protein
VPSSLHQALIEIVRHRPALVAELLAHTLGVDLPHYQDVRLEAGDLTDLTPTEYRADAVVVLTDAGAALAVVVEVQLGRDADKRWTWPVYLATLGARLRCPTMLLVVCADPRTATWCAAPIDVGHPGWTLRPLVLGPDRVPLVTDPDQAKRSPELTVLSAMAHSSHPAWPSIAEALLSALDEVDESRATLYSDVVFAALPAAARRTLEAMMTTRTYEYQSDFVRRYVFQGRAEGEADAVLTFLETRGIPVPDEARARITGCTDLDQLKTWVRRAVTAATVDELFDDEA